MSANSSEQYRLVTPAQLRIEFNIVMSRTTLRRMSRSGTFPVPVQISPRRIAYRAAAIRAWIDARDAQRKLTELFS